MARLGPVGIEALRLARLMIKDAIKKNGTKLSYFASSDITKAARELIEHDKSIMRKAKRNCKRLGMIK